MSPKSSFCLRLAICSIIFLCIFEAAYWPLKPGFELKWWQSYILADAGFFVGAPVWFVLILIGRLVTPSEMLCTVSFFTLTTGYLLLIFALLGWIEKYFFRR
jgi:hypothetical protein